MAKTFLEKRLRRAHRRNQAIYQNLAAFTFDVIGRSVSVDGLYEREQLEFLRMSLFSRLSKRRVCLDIGANIGNHAVFFSDFFEQVIAFEPNPRTFQLLRLNAELANNIKALNIGASDKTQRLQAHIDATNAGAARVMLEGGPNNTSSASPVFELVDIDSYLSGIERMTVDFIKIDVEGHESAAFRGMKTLLSQGNAVVCLELLAKSSPEQAGDAIAQLKSAGYDCFIALEETLKLKWLPLWLANFLRSAAKSMDLRASQKLQQSPLPATPNQDYAMILAFKTASHKIEIDRLA